MNCAVRILRIFSFALIALFLPAAAAAAAGPNRDPLAHADVADAPRSPLDLRSVTFGQRGTEIVMRMTTAGEWEPSQLAPGSGNALCVKIFYGKLPTPRARVCVIDRGENLAGLVYLRLDPTGRPVQTRIVSASMRRPDKRSVQAIFEPSSANLGQGRFSWQAETTWACDVPAGCNDLAPDRGNVIARIRPLAEPRCFGAASRNPRHRCRNRALRLAVVPPPADAVLTPNARCSIVSFRVPYTCQFGVRAAIANRTVALLGDSHAAHWRGALEVVAQARQWRGFSLTRSGCPFSTAPPALEKGRRESCARWRRAVRRWFTRHPQVQTVFVSTLSTAGVRAPKGRSRREYQVQGFIRAWRMLPRTVRQIIVLRDVPYGTPGAHLCVERAMRERKRADVSCAISRRKALKRDPASIAARRPGTGRAHVIDLTPHMCSRRLCFPVVGGVLVHKDTTHITALFATTLGPFVARKVDRLL